MYFLSSSLRSDDRKYVCVCRFTLSTTFTVKNWSLFLESLRNFSGPKDNFSIKICWILAQFLAHKPVNFASWTVSFIALFWKIMKLWSWSKPPANAKQLSGPRGPFHESPDNFSGLKSCFTFAFRIKVSIILKTIQWNYNLTKQNWAVWQWAIKELWYYSADLDFKICLRPRKVEKQAPEQLPGLSREKGPWLDLATSIEQK